MRGSQMNRWLKGLGRGFGLLLRLSSCLHRGANLSSDLDSIELGFPCSSSCLGVSKGLDLCLEDLDLLVGGGLLRGWIVKD